MLTVRYIAIDIDFPHRLISFDNVPLNYSASPLTIFSTRSSTKKTYRNTINFTKQAGSSPYNYFPSPLSNNKIVLFMTSLFIDGIVESSPTQSTPINLEVDYKIKTNETYQLSLTFGVETLLTRLHFSMVIFNEEDV